MLRFKVNLYLCLRRCLHKAEQLAVRLSVHLNWQQAIFERVVAENIGEVSADHGAEAETCQRPDRVFARAARAEVMPCQLDLRALRLRLIQDEIRARRALRVIAPVVEERCA